MLSGSDIIINTLIEQGCDVIFGYPGGQVLDIYESLYKYKDKIKHVLTAHEQGAAHAADGYARSTGKVGVAFATSGPGATNLVTGIATAYLDSIPVVLITGNVRTDQIGTDSFQEIDITGITLPITKHNYFVSDIGELADTIREAFELASSGRPGPVLVDVAKDVQTAKCEYVPAPKVQPDESRAAKDIRIEAAAEIINESDRPYIYFGGGIITAGAEDELIALSEKIDAPMGCSLMGISAVPTSNERFLGMEGMHGHYASSIALSKADCIISLGVRFNDRATGSREQFAKKAKIVQIDVDGSELSKNITADVGMRGDVKLTLQKLISLLEDKTHPKWNEEIDQLRQKEEELSDTREGMTPKNIMDVISTFIDEDTPVVTDVGQHQMWAAQYLDIKKQRRFISSGGLGTMGFSLGASIGTYFATGLSPIMIAGDGGFGMCLNEMATAVTNDVPVTIVILNNGVLGMVRQMQTLFLGGHYSQTTLERKTDFVALAKAFVFMNAPSPTAPKSRMLIIFIAPYSGQSNDPGTGACRQTDSIRR